MKPLHRFRAARRILLAPALLSALSAPLAAPLDAAAAEPLLVADLAPGSDASGFFPDRLEAAGGRLYLRVSDQRHGGEPWVSDGSAAGTRRLADVCPGACSSDPSLFTEVNGRVVFATREDDGHGSIAAAGPAGVETIAGGLEVTSAFVPYGGRLYFAARQPGDRALLYRTDGTREGTVPAAELCGGGAASCETDYPLAAQGGRLFYHRGGTLYAYTPALGPVALAAATALRDMTPAGASRLVFVACYSSPGDCRTHVTDGTPGGTLALPIGGRIPRNFVPFAGRVFFVGEYGEVFSTDGTAAGSRMEDIVGPGGTPAGEPPAELLGASATHLIYSRGRAPDLELRSRSAAGTDLLLRSGLAGASRGGAAGGRYFVHYRRGNVRRLAATDGLPSGTFDVAEGEIGSSGAALGGRFYFPFQQGEPQSARLWSSDGTPAGTSPIAFAPELPRSSNPRFHRQGGSLLLMAGAAGAWLDPESLARQPLRQGLEVQTVAGSTAFAFDFTADPPALVGLKENGGEEALLSGVRISELAPAADGRIYFSQAGSGQRLWESTGTAGGTRMLFDLRPGTVCPACPSLPARITPSGDRVFFVAGGAGEASEFALGSWRRGAAMPVELMPFPGTLPLLAVGGGRAVFVLPAASPDARSQLWVSDGSVAGTRPFFDLPVFSTLEGWAAAGPRLYFALAQHHGVVPAASLWVSDLTTAGTSQLLAGATSFTELAAAGGHLYFAGRSPAGVEPGHSDGTPAGTRWLDLLPGPGSSGARGLHVLADRRAVFAAAADAAGDELWISDGTVAGSARLTDLAPGADASSPDHFAEAPAAGGQRLFFGADDGVVGREPWALDLPAPDLQPCPDHLLCLREGRFEVGVEVEAGGETFTGGRVLAETESGIFRFFSGNNWEMLVKVLDGCAINDAFWVYAAAATDVAYRLTVLDRWSGATRIYDSSGPARPILDSAAFATCGAAPQPPAYLASSEPAPAARRCPDDGSALCLGPGGRYRVRQEWRTAVAAGVAQPVPYGTADSGLFTFFSPSNWEMLVKVLDGCALNGKIWVFAAGTTDVGWTLAVEDGETGLTRTYGTPLGIPARTVADTAAFDCD